MMKIFDELRQALSLQKNAEAELGEPKVIASLDQ